jgi:hypothetical protein
MRAVSVALLLLLATPEGGRFTAQPGAHLAPALCGETGFAAALLFVFGLFARLAGGRLGPRASKVCLVLFALAGSVHLGLAQTSQELLRWVGRPLHLDFLLGYAPFADGAFMGRVLRGDALALGAAITLFVAGTALLLRVALVAKAALVPGGTLLAGAGAAALVLSGLAPALAPDRNGWERARPATTTLLSDVAARLSRLSPPADLDAGLAELSSFLGKPEGWAPDPRYPLWHAVADEEAAYARFRARPFAGKPDVVFVVMESVRGWETDFRREDGAQHLPELHRLFGERGIEFVRFHANGYPSVEGWAGIHLGLWPHPSRTLLHHPDSRHVALADIFQRAGYHRVLVTGTAPGFEWMAPWYARWFEEVCYRPDESTDGALAARALARWDARPEGKPLFLVLQTLSTHPPVYYPKDGRPEPKSPREHYLRALGYMDASLGALFDGLRRSPRWASTIVVCVGDHSVPNPPQSIQGSGLGTPHAGQTWTPLLIAGAGLSSGTVREEIASHVDIGPTLLGCLGLDVSNHFLGRDLLAPEAKETGALGLRFGGLALTEGPKRWHVRLDDSSFHGVWLWEERAPGEVDPEGGTYAHGVRLEWTDEDEQRAARAKAMTRAYGWLLDSDRLMPPVAISPRR